MPCIFVKVKEEGNMEKTMSEQQRGFSVSNMFLCWSCACSSVDPGVCHNDIMPHSLVMFW